MVRVLGTGFVGARCLIQLLAAAMKRPPRSGTWRESDLRYVMSGGAGEVGERRTLFCADLNTDAGWAEAAADYDYVLHVASPYPITVPRDENELIMPARDGALRAARDAGVKRLVLAIGYGAKGWTNAFTEKDWTNLNDSSLQPYQKSKTIAERAAWDFIAREGASWNWLWSTLSVFSGRFWGQTIQPRSCS